MNKKTLDYYLKYCPESGIFTWNISFNQHPVGSIAGSLDGSGHRQIKICGTLYHAHRLAWLTMTGEWPSEQVDHTNQQPDDNRWCNLRAATHGQNKMNSRTSKNNKTGVKGLSWHKTNRWHAQIKCDGKHHYLYTKDKQTAIDWLKSKREELHGEFANHG